MPLIYLPLIMYASWMEFLAQPFKTGTHASDPDAPAADSRSATRPTG
jgi:hypothetical protein